MRKKETKQEQEEKTKLSFFERWKLRRELKKIRKAVNIQKITALGIAQKQRELNDKEKEGLEILKQEVIKAIVGDKEKEQIGLAEIFEISGENGKEITKEELEKTEIDELTNLLEELLNSLEKEV